jgi:hypothetical protein
VPITQIRRKCRTGDQSQTDNQNGEHKQHLRFHLSLLVRMLFSKDPPPQVSPLGGSLKKIFLSYDPIDSPPFTPLIFPHISEAYLHSLPHSLTEKFLVPDYQWHFNN